MEIRNIFSEFKLPNSYLFFSNDYIFIIDKNNKNIDKKEYFKISLSKNDNIPEDIMNRLRMSLNKSIGLILNSSFFVFNILKFDKLPFGGGKTEELVNWRIEKIFPENLDNYVHKFFKLDSKHIWSILLKKETVERITSFMNKLGINYTYLGSSTVEIANHLFASYLPIKKFLSKKTPDFFLEIWGDFATLLFQENNIPFYIRKFNFSDASDLYSEIEKTNNFISNNYNIKPSSFVLLGNNTDINKEELVGYLNKNGLKHKGVKKPSVFISGVNE